VNTGGINTPFIRLAPYRRNLGVGLFVVLCSVLSPSNLPASSGTEGAAFLDIPVGAAPAALGSAYTALANDAYAPVWNPAGLGFLAGTQVAAQHLSYLESMHYEYLSFVMPFPGARSPEPGAPGSRLKALGFSAQHLGTGDISA
jgi:hypothetical protein